MPRLIVEIHIPLIAAAGVADDDYPFPWIDDVEEFLESLADEDGEELDDGEEVGQEYLFFLTGASEPQLIALGRRVIELPRVPAGAYLTVNNAGGHLGQGRRVDPGVS